MLYFIHFYRSHKVRLKVTTGKIILCQFWPWHYHKNISTILKLYLVCKQTHTNTNIYKHNTQGQIHERTDISTDINRYAHTRTSRTFALTHKVTCKIISYKAWPHRRTQNFTIRFLSAGIYPLCARNKWNKKIIHQSGNKFLNSNTCIKESKTSVYINIIDPNRRHLTLINRLGGLYQSQKNLNVLFAKHSLVTGNSTFYKGQSLRSFDGLWCYAETVSGSSITKGKTKKLIHKEDS